ncbi:myeloid differentiation primary response protein MyD88 [Culicoides brevitarsis]|uniref:myeloid differentiation primary response protein MyD88 n=1 Tax=Culicoides brevitarsis TaxID=469753 RepID=UPI00307C4625
MFLINRMEKQIVSSNGFNKTSFKDVPLSALQENSLLVLYTLNQEQILLAESGHFRDWRGVLALAPLDSTFKNFILKSSDQNYMKILLNQWMKLVNSNFEQLQETLKTIDRHDVYEDALEHFKKDAYAYKLKTSSETSLERTPKGSYIITSLDRYRINNGLKMIIYDAFLMYDEKDEDFAQLIKETLENSGMHICIKNDFLGGIPFEHDAAMTLIAKRCRRVIIIISKHFLDSTADIFMSKYAQHIGIERSNRKVVPCLREECQIPSNLKILFHLKYYKDGRLFNFWKKLYEAVAYEPADNDFNSEEFEVIPHYAYFPLNISHSSPREISHFNFTERHMENSVTNTMEKVETTKLENELLTFLGPSPPTDSPNNSTTILNDKKTKNKQKTKTKNPVKVLKHIFSTKKQKITS